MRRHDVTLLSPRHPDEDKALKLALHLNSDYHQMDESSGASLSYLKAKHEDAHGGKKRGK